MAFSNNHTLISRSAKIVGDLYFSGDLQIEGRICGNVIAEGDKEAKLVVADSGIVEGDISASVAVINGKVVGDIHSSKHIELAAKAIVDGSIHYQLIEMVKGSQVNGNLIFSGAQAAAPAPAANVKAVSSASQSTGKDSVTNFLKTSGQ